MLGYAAIAKQLYTDSRSKREGNIYWSWIENYIGEDYFAAVKAVSGKSNRIRVSRKLGF